MKFYISCIIILLKFQFIFCQNDEVYNQYQKENFTLNENTRNFLELKLIRAREKGDLLTICNTQLQQGKDPKGVYQILLDSINENNSVCLEVILNTKKYKARKYSDALMRLYPEYWSNIHLQCESKVDTDQVWEYEQEKTKSLKQIQNFNKIDPNKIDSALVKILDTIYFDDQFFRNSMNPFDYKNDWIKQLKQDSKNYLKAKTILIQEGYPSLNKTGFRHKSTLWLVLHHLGDIEERISNKKFIIQAYQNGSISESQLRLFNDRTINLEN